MNFYLLIILKEKQIKKGEWPRGRYKLGRWSIKDDHRFKKTLFNLR